MGESHSRKVKIIATIGPACNSREMIKKLLLAGVNMFRFNLSHGTHEGHKKAIDLIRSVEKELGRHVAVVGDLQGPKLRVHTFANQKVTLQVGQKFTLDQDPTPGNEQRVCLPHPELFKALEIGHTVLLNDGIMKLEVTSISPKVIETKVLIGGELSDHKGLNVPYVYLPIPPLTEKDKEDALFGQSIGLDFLAMSFVQSAEDVEALRQLTKNKIPILAKIEKPRAVEHLEAITKAAYGLHIDRGDLGAEMTLEEVPTLQKKIIRMAHRHGKPVVVATQMIESMIHCPVPTRAEASDVATAVYDGADAIMLSAETAMGEFPLETIDTINKIIEHVEKDELYPTFSQAIEFHHPPSNPDAIAVAARDIIQQLGAAALVSFSATGTAILSAANKRPLVPIVGLVPDEITARRLSLVWGVHPMVVPTFGNFKDMAKEACKIVKHMKFATPGDKIVVTGSFSLDTQSHTNLLSIETVS